MKTSLLKLARAAITGTIALLSIVAQAASVPAFKVEAIGQGKPMILIPGLASSGDVWKETVAHYDKHYRCYVLTLAGFAGTPATDGPLLQQAEQQLLKFMDEEKLDKPTIVGHSLGGFLALKLAAEHADKVGMLVILDSLPAMGAAQVPSMTEAQLKELATQYRDNMLNGDPESHTRIRRTMVSNMATKAEDIERVIDWGAKSDRVAVANAMYEMMSTDLRQSISGIKAPTLVLGTWIGYKQYVPRELSESTFKLQYAKLPGVKIVLADNAKHFIMYDDPQWLYARMDEFLK
ncbi:MAG: alpha/beta hydrolase [Pseudomonadota bacterium]